MKKIKHHLSFKIISFHAAASVHRYPHIISLFIVNETIISTLFQWLTLMLTYLYTYISSLFTVSSKQSNTFYKTSFLNCLERKYKIIVKNIHLIPKNAKISPKNAIYCPKKSKFLLRTYPIFSQKLPIYQQKLPRFAIIQLLPNVPNFDQKCPILGKNYTILSKKDPILDKKTNSFQKLPNS